MNITDKLLRLIVPAEEPREVKQVSLSSDWPNPHICSGFLFFQSKPLLRASCVMVLAITGTSVISLSVRYGCKGLEKVRGKVVYVGKVLEEDDEDQQGVHTLLKGTMGMIPPMLRN